MNTRTLAPRLCGFLVAALLAASAPAATYYVDASGGSDSAAGTSTGAAWKTISKVNGRSYQPGDSILFKRGGVWREQLTLSSAGNASAPITWGAYGAGPAPSIRGANLVTGFSQFSGNIWRAALAADPSQVFINDARGKEEASSAAINAAGEWYWGGGQLYVYSTSDPDTAFTAPGVEATARDHAVAFNSRDYSIVRDLQFEKTKGACVFMTNTLNHATLENCVVLQGNPNAGSDNASVLLSSNSTYCVIRDCTVGRNTGNDVADQGFASFIGIQIKGANHIVERNTVYHNSIEAENLWGFNAYGIRLFITSGTAEIRDNTVVHTGSHGIYVDAGTVSGDAVLIHDNTLSYCGQAGISVYKTRAQDGVGGIGYIYRNDVSYCDRLAGTPGGNGNAACGIHFNDQGEAGVDPAKPFIRWHCYENRIYKCQAPSSPKNEDSGGIAVDFNANRVKVYRNLVYNNWGKGIYIFNADDCEVFGNIFYGNDSGLTVSSVGGVETASNNKIYNNTFYRNYNGDAYGPGYDCEILFGLRSNNTTIKNNILYADPAARGYYYFAGSTGLVVDYNCSYRSGGNPYYTTNDGWRTLAQWRGMSFDAHGMQADPVFADAAGAFFALAEGSPCVDAGEPLTGVVGKLLDPASGGFPYGTSEPTAGGGGWEIGAFAFLPILTGGAPEPWSWARTEIE